jgi:hypothetical protein
MYIDVMISPYLSNFTKVKWKTNETIHEQTQTASVSTQSQFKLICVRIEQSFHTLNITYEVKISSIILLSQWTLTFSDFIEGFGFIL